MAKNYRLSFSAAFNGIALFFKEEFNARLHLIASIVVLLLAWYFKIDAMEWLILILATSAVFVAEIFNTALEQLCNKVTKEEDPLIKKVKDISAAAVLVSVIFAIVLALIIFIPKIV